MTDTTCQRLVLAVSFISLLRNSAALETCKSTITFAKPEFNFIKEGSQITHLYCNKEPFAGADSETHNLCASDTKVTTEGSLYLACTAGANPGQLLVGYNVYGCDTTTQIFGNALITDSKLAPLSECYNGTDDQVAKNVCKNVSVMNSDSKLIVDNPSAVAEKALDEMHIFVESYQEATYKLKCGEGYDFQKDVDHDAVYGKCTAINNKVNNISPQVTNGNTPVCFATCPAKFSSQNIDDVENLKEVAGVTASGRRSESTAKLAVTCEDGYAVAQTAPSTYSFQCDGLTDDEPDAGKWSCTTCPNCLPKCQANAAAENVSSQHDHLLRLTIAEGVNGDELDGTPVCEEGYALDKDASTTYKYTCGIDGKFKCSDGTVCPVCKGNCDWPLDWDDADHPFDYVYRDKTERKEGEKAMPGEDHVEAVCKNASLNLVGQRFLSCIDGTLRFDVQNDTECAEVDICEMPKIQHATISTTKNLRVDEKYIVTCLNDSFFDMNSRMFTAKNADHGNYERTLRCKNPADNGTKYIMPEVLCYVGCDMVHLLNGNVIPSMEEEAAAPYNAGQTLTFKCEKGFDIAFNTQTGAKTEMCVPGKPIAVPVCAYSGGMSSVASGVLLSVLMVLQLA